MGDPSVKAVSAPCVLGEGPHWDADNNVLYYVDIMSQTVHKYDPAKNKHTSVKIDGGTVSFVVPVLGQRHQFVISVGRKIALLTWDGESARAGRVEALAAVDDEDGRRGNRFNDAKADPSGRLWAGTMAPEEAKLQIKEHNGALFSVSRGRHVTKHVSGVTCSNGLAWSKDRRTMFYIDSLTRLVEAFDFNIETGYTANRRTAFDFHANGVPGVPDGMTIDAEDKLWVACFEGGRVIQVDPTSGQLLRTVLLPSPKITSVVFGGARLDELYVTSATTFMTEAERAQYPSAGCTYRVQGVGARGVPMDRVAL